MRNLLGSRWRVAVLVAACLALVVSFTARPRAASPNMVISQIYGAGGNNGAVLRNDYVELFNRSTEAVSLNGWSIQYASATGTGNFGSGASQLVVLPNATVEPGQYYLVQLGSGGTNGALLPAADATGTIGMAAGGGKVALVNGTTSLGCNGGSSPCSPDQLARIIDLVGWDGANFYEGTAAAPSTSTILAVFRANNGCTDTDNNGADFAAATPAPRNTASPVYVCPQSLPPTVSGQVVPATAMPGYVVTVTGKVTSGSNPPSTGVAVAGDMTQIGGAPNQALNDDGLDGDVIAGDGIFTCQVTVSATTPGAKLITLTVSDAQTRSSSSTVTLNVELPPPFAAIHEIQGAGSTSPMTGQRVETKGVVTGVKYNGFFIQAPESDYDGDPSTSEGVFVYTNSAPPSTAAVGNLVDVVGTVQEYPAGANSATELVSPTITVTSTGNTLPGASPIDGIVTATGGFQMLEQLERYEGMRVSVASMVAVGPPGTYTSAGQTRSDGQFYAVMTGQRTFREPGLEPTAPSIDGMPANVPHFDGNLERLLVDSDALGLPPLNVTSGAIVTGITGPLDVNNGTYTIDPESTPTVSGGVVATPLPEATAGQFTVASWNMLNFSGDATRIAKASAVIRDVLRMPDIIGVEEMKDLTTLEALADAVNQPLPEGSATYTAHLLAAEVGQDVGFLVKSSVTDVEVLEVGRDVTFPHPVSGAAMTLNDRPPLVLRGTISDPGRGSFPVTVVVNHLRSLIDVDANSDTGRFVRAKRLAQAEYLANLIAGYQAHGEHVISVGDYNAYQFNDGYVDVIGTILGTPTPGDQVLLASSDLVDPDFIDLMETLPEADRYSYVENGNAQVLDHIIVSHDMEARVAGVAAARINADFPKIYGTDPGRPERVSDHDPVVGYFAIPDTKPPVISAVTPDLPVLWAPNHAMVPVTIAVSSADAVDAAPVCRITDVTGNDGAIAADWLLTGPLAVALRAERAGKGDGRTYTIGVTCTDASGNVSLPATTTVFVPHDQRK